MQPRGATARLSLDFLRTQYNVLASRWALSSTFSGNRSVSPHTGRLLLTDSPNAFACSHEFNSRPVGRTTRLGMSYLRDVLRVLRLPYVSSPFNLADLGTKHPSGRRIVDSANSTNIISICSLSRKELKSVLHFPPQ